MIGTSLKSLGNPVRGRSCSTGLRCRPLSGDMELQDYIGSSAPRRSTTTAGPRRHERCSSRLRRANARDPEMRSRASYYLGEMAKARNDAPALLHHAEEALRALRLSPKRTQRMLATFVALQG
jgi:hypothetical protein